MEGIIGVSLKMDTQPLVQGANNAKFVMQDLAQTAKVVSESAMPPMAGNIDANTPSSSAGSFFATKDQYKDLIIAINNVTQALKEQGTPGSGFGGSGSRQRDTRGGSSAEMLKELGQIVTLGLGLYTGYEQFQTTQIRKRMRLMDADPYGAMQEELQGRANMGKTLLGSAGTALGIGLSFTPLGPIGGMLIGNLIKEISSGIISAQTEKQIAEIQERQQKVDKYRQRLDVMDESYLRFGGKSMWETQSALLSASENTGMGIDDFMRLANRFSGYGISSVGRAGALANAAAKASRYTGASSDSLAAYLGTQERYGGDAIGGMNYAYSAAIASGLQRNQFGEFLDGLQSVIENGISKGYVKSTKEVSDTMVMFDKLSGGSKFWQGEQGFNRLQSISNGLASATALNSSTQLAVYQAMSGLSGGDMLDTFALMEKGLDVNSFKAIATRFKNIYGGDRYSEVMAWKEISGLNYNGAMQLQQMAQGDLSKVDATMIKNLAANSDYQSDKTRVSNALNHIDTQVSEWGSKLFPEYLTMLQKIAGESTGEPTKLMASDYIKNVGTSSTISRKDSGAYLNAYLDEITTDEQLKTLYQNEDFNSKFGYIMEYARNNIHNYAYDRYTNAPEEEKEKHREAAEKEAARNQQTLELLVEQLKLLVESNGKTPVVYNLQKSR